MSKSRDAFRTISEVSDQLGTPAHVLRFWESKFSQVKPVKRAGGRRYYRPGDVDLLAGIKKLLHDDGMTIKGAQKLLREQGVKHVVAIGADTLATTVAQVDPAPGQDTAPQESAPVESLAQPAPAPEPSAAVTNVVPLSATHAPKTPDPTPSLETKSEASVGAAPAKSPLADIPTDPTDSDSKAPARLFHLLQKASHSGLSARAQAITPLLNRMQVLHDRIVSR
ncbi:UNVERIFIED_CONTAM: hypothetical protein GTU68_026758 [Idotea baltica]|nr:hypothetical protein [Idotea baltica]